jgi:hypothetical protein
VGGGSLYFQTSYSANFDSITQTSLTGTSPQVFRITINGMNDISVINPAPVVPCTDCGNTFNAQPSHPAHSFSFVLKGDVRNQVDTAATATDPTVNAFAYVNRNFFSGGGTSSVAVSLDGNGNTVIIFTGSNPILPSYTFNYGFGSTWPHFGFEGSKGTSLSNIAQFWNYGDNLTQSLPNLSTVCPAVTGRDLHYAVFFAEVSFTGDRNGGQWTECAFANGTNPDFLLTNTTGRSEKLSNVGFLLSDTAISLDSLNFGGTPPPGRPGSRFTRLRQFDGLTLRPNGRFSFAVCSPPDLAPSAGRASARALPPRATPCRVRMP